MNCQMCRERMAELADARLDESTVASDAHAHGRLPRLRAWIPDDHPHTRCARCEFPRMPPPMRLRARVTGLIETEKLTLQSQAEWASSPEGPRREHGRRRPWWPMVLQALGACALVAVGFALGRANGRRASARAPSRTGRHDGPDGRAVGPPETHHGRPPGDRHDGHAVRKPDEQVIDGLINTMAFDTSVNVRLNALNALYEHRGPGGRAGGRCGLPSARAQSPGPGLDDRLPRGLQGPGGLARAAQARCR